MDENIFGNTRFWRKVLDISASGLMVTDRNGILIFVNDSFCEIHGVIEKDVVGKHVTDVIENTRMHIVAETGTPEIDEIQSINGHEIVVSRTPIIEDDQCVGVVGKIRFLDFTEVRKLTWKIARLEEKIKKADLKHPDTKYTFSSLVAVSKLGRKSMETGIKAASSRATVLLLGESGVGKEVFAHSIHNMSTRSGGPFIRLNCSAIQESLFESELFGYVEGAFTGAKKGGKKGKFELAHNGTILLDEIGDMPLNIQAKLLRVIQEKEIDKVGGEKISNIDVRIVAATNKNLEQEVANGKFRGDLFYRLNVLPINIPPLRERRSDIPVLTDLIWNDLKKEYGIYHKNLNPDAIDVLYNHDWPGNIRELRNILERVMILVSQETINGEHIRTLLEVQQTEMKCKFSEGCDLQTLISQTEKNAICQALLVSNDNRSEAARKLGISRALLYKKMHKYNIMKGKVD